LEALRSGATGLAVTYSIMVVGVILTVLYSLRFLFSRSYFTLRITSWGYSSLKSNSLVASRLLLFRLSIVSGKKTFFRLIPLLNYPNVNPYQEVIHYSTSFKRGLLVLFF